MMRYVLHSIITLSIIFAGVLSGFIAKAYFNENNFSKSSLEENIGERLQLKLSDSAHETIIREESLAHKTESYIKEVSFPDKFLGQYRNYTNQFAMSLKWLQTDNYVALQYNNIIVVDFNGDFILDYKIVIPNKNSSFLLENGTPQPAMRKYPKR